LCFYTNDNVILFTLKTFNYGTRSQIQVNIV